MFDNIKNWFSEKGKSKVFKAAVIAAVLVAAAITVKNINNEDINRTKSSSTAKNADSAEKKEETGFHIGVGHIVMLVVFTAAYGIDRIIVYKNNLEDEKKYNNHKED